jgi:hypothetical protein
MNACDTECNPDVDELPSWSARMAKVFCYVIGQIFALAILALWVTCTLAEPLTLRVVEATPRLNKPNPFIIVRFDDDGRKAFAQFTTEHVGEDIEWLVAGRRERVRVHDPIYGGVLSMFLGQLGDDEIVEIANRLATEGRIEVNAVVPTRQ